MQQVIKKELIWETNFNGKMDCQAFLHITIFPPGKPRPDPADLKTTVFTITTRDGSHKPVDVLMDDIIFLQLSDLLAIITIPSHGMSPEVFEKYFIEKHPDANAHTECMVAMYARPENKKVFSAFRKVASINGNYWIA